MLFLFKILNEMRKLPIIFEISKISMYICSENKK